MYMCTHMYLEGARRAQELSTCKTDYRVCVRLSDCQNVTKTKYTAEDNAHYTKSTSGAKKVRIGKRAEMRQGCESGELSGGGSYTDHMGGQCERCQFI